MSFLNEIIERCYQQGDGVTVQVLSTMKPFVLDEDAHNVIVSLATSEGAGKLKKASVDLFWPAGNTWLEWTYKPTQWDRRVKVGVCFTNGTFGDETEIHRGYLQAYMSDGERFTQLYGQSALGVVGTNDPLWLRGAHKDKYDELAHQRNKLRIAKAHQELYDSEPEDENYRLIQDMVLGTLALLNTHRMVKTVHTDYTKLNKRRIQRGKWPLMSHQTVKVNLNKQEIAAVVGPQDGEQQPLTFIRAYLRLRLGRIELVTPHWRGNGELGIRKPRYELGWRCK